MADVTLVVAMGASVGMSFVALVAVYAARYKKVPPDHAMILYGRKYQGGHGYEVWTGGGKFILPIVESYAMISLEPFPVDHVIENVATDVLDVRGVLVHVSASAIARVSDDPDVIRKAASMLLHKSRQELRDLVLSVLEGHTRGLLATERKPESDAARHADRVRTAANSDLRNVGLEVRSLTLRIRPADAPAEGSKELTELSRELHAISMRLDRIEERLGLRG